MEINVTPIVASFGSTPDGAMRYSASIAEFGPRAGPMTWGNACADAPALLTLTPDQCDAARKHFRAYGAWGEEEITSWLPEKLTALIVQEVAACCRECPDIDDLTLESDPADWATYRAAAEAGQVSGRMYRGDDGQVYFYLGE